MGFLIDSQIMKALGGTFSEYDEGGQSQYLTHPKWPAAGARNLINTSIKV